jgi:hypothetical protein
VVERITDMPAGTIGFRGEGELTDEDFRDRIAPVVNEALEAGGGVRMLLIPPPSFGSGDVPALADMIRKQPEAHLGHRNDWRRIAVVTSSGMLRRTSRVWTRLVPVPIKAFAPDEEQKARTWLLES